MPCSPDEARAQVLELASGLGFARTGIAEVRDYPEFARVREWIHRGYAGEMGYLERRLEERTDPAQVLEGARSVIVVAICYDTGEPGSQQPRAEARGWVSRYAWGQDYHEVVGQRLETFVERLLAFAPDARCRA